MKRYFEYQDAQSSKFWEITRQGTEIVTRYGKIGTEGKQSFRRFDTGEETTKAFKRLIAEKTSKGYKELPPGLENCKSYKKGTLSFGELLPLVKQSKQEFIPELITEQAARRSSYDTLLHKGDLIIQGEMDTYTSGFNFLLVQGNLEIQGLFESYNDPHAFVIVMGDMKAQNIINAGYLEVHGDLRVENALVGDYDYGEVYVVGDTSAHFYFPESLPFMLQGNVHFEYATDTVYPIPEGKQVIIKNDRNTTLDSLVDTVFDSREWDKIMEKWEDMDKEMQAQYLECKYDYYVPDFRKIRQHMIAGTPIFKNTG